MDEKLEEIQAEITALKILLRDSDYNANKLIESMVAAISDAAEVDIIPKFILWLANARLDFWDIMKARADWREKINVLEEEANCIETARNVATKPVVIGSDKFDD